MGVEAFSVILAKNLWLPSVHTPRLNLKTVHHLFGKGNFRTAQYPGCGVVIAHRTSQIYSEREQWTIMTGKVCGVLKNHVTLSKATNRSVQFGGERNVNPIQVEDQARRG